jgi:hypothetical protein
MEQERDREGYLYPIGSVLTHRALLHGSPIHDAVRLFVVSRTREGCPGGEQLHYHCRLVSGAGAWRAQNILSPELWRLNEVELAPLPPAGLRDGMDALLHHWLHVCREVNKSLDQMRENEILKGLHDEGRAGQPEG